MMYMHKRLMYAALMVADLPWDLLRSLLAVLREGSLGKAARSLDTTQPNVGRHVRQLEERIGAQLFERHARRLVPTALAHTLAEAARAMQQGADAVAQLLRAREAEATRSVRISASRMTATHLLPALLAHVLQRDASLRIELLAEDTLSNLAEREADFAVRLVRPTQPGLVARSVGHIHFGLYGARSYLRQRAAPADVAGLAGHAVVGFDRSALMLRGAHRLGLALARSTFAFRSDDRVVHWAAIRAGVGLGVLPTYLAAGDKSLTRVLPALKLTPARVWLVGQRDVLARPHVAAVYTSVRDQMVALLAAAPL